MKKIALFSLNDTSEADQFASQLIELGWDILASSETVALLREKGLCVQSIADFTGVQEDYGFPPTLHPKVEYCLTANSQQRIELVYVIPYPISKGNDVGGRTLLALALKGDRIAVMSVGDMKRVISAISETGEIPEQLRLDLHDKACFEIVSHYSSMLRSRKKFDCMSGRFAYDLLNGENPYQLPATAFVSDITDDALSLLKFKQVTGDDPCFTNIADADCILNTICLATEGFRLNTGTAPYICVAAKHGNACGMGTSKVCPSEAIEKALFGNPRSIWGGEVITNFIVDEQFAEMLLKSGKRGYLLGDKSWMLDLVMAPSFTSEAISILGKRKERKLLENNSLLSPSLNKSRFDYRIVRGGFLKQPPATYVLNLQESKMSGNVITESEISSLIVAWAIAYSSSLGGNEIALAKDGALLGSGGGPSTVEAVQVAVTRAIECGHDVKGAAFAADAFFPFIDAPSILCDAGITLGCVPSGGKKEQDVKDFFLARDSSVFFLPEEFRGFCRH